MAAQSELRVRPAKLEGEPQRLGASGGSKEGGVGSLASRRRACLHFLTAITFVGLVLLLRCTTNDQGDGAIQSAAHSKGLRAEQDEEASSLQQVELRDLQAAQDEDASSLLPVEAPAVTSVDTEVPSTPMSEAQRWREQCYFERDFGLIERAATPSQVFCASPEGPVSDTTKPLTKRTKVSLFDAPSGIRPALFEDVLLDMTTATVHRDIASIAEDGGNHDPRFNFARNMVYCACDELHDYAIRYREERNETFLMWDPALAYPLSRDHSDASLVCGGANTFRPVDLFVDNSDKLVEFPGRVLLMTRHDDHNPFFQVSHAINAWVMMRALNWDPKTVTLIHFDAGYPSPIDALHQKLLVPQTTIIRGREIMGKRLLFSGEMMLAPFETTGPMMQHLDDWEPCWESELFRTFRDEALTAMEVTEPTKEEEKRKDIIVTIISRKPYNGRVVQRVWINEDDVVRRLRATYRSFEGRKIVFRSIDFVDLSLQKQMQLMVESDVVVSMHGAGLVNVFWTRPGTLVLEIFPKERRRWGYRNLCQFVGCDWHEFRGGIDIPTGKEANANDKLIPYEEWQAFFGPLFEQKFPKKPTALPSSEVPATAGEEGDIIPQDSHPTTEQDPLPPSANEPPPTTALPPLEIS